MSAKTLDGRALAARVLAEARAKAAAVKRRRGRAPRLALVSAPRGDAQAYLKAVRRACEAAGVELVVHKLSRAPRVKLLGLLADLAADPAADALMIETPLPHGLTVADASSVIPPNKDVEGLSPCDYGRLFLAKTWREAEGLVGPCTAYAIARLALFARVPLAGRRAVVIGRSATVGRPAAHLLSTLDMTVTLAHSRTRNLAKLCREADLLAVAAGRAGLVKPSWVKRGAVVIDAGIHATRKGLVGDCAPGVAARAGRLTPVPGGVGPVTTALAVLNAARLAAAKF